MAAEHSAGFLSEMLELLDDVVFHIDANGRWKFLNHAIWRLTGQQPDELIEKPYWEIAIAPADARGMQEDLHALREGRIDSLTRDFQVRRGDGESRWVRFQSRAQFDETDTFCGVSGTLRDFHSEQRLTDYAAQESGTKLALETEREQQRKLIENAPVAMALLDREGCFQVWSTAWQREFSLDEGLKDQQLSEVLPELALHWGDSFERALAGEILESEEDVIDLEGGETMILRWAMHPYASGENIDRVVIAASDVSALSQARKAAIDASELKSDFLATMSHEIRTPLNGVIGVTSLLSDTPLNDQQRHYLDLLRNSGQALLALINDILDFSKIEAGKLDIELIEVDLESEIEHTLAMMMPSAQSKGIDLAFECRDPLPASVVCDPGRLRQILINLVGNAIKFTKVGGVSVIVSSKTIDDDKVGISVAVSDSGCGIEAFKLKHLFQPFTQADSSTTRTHGGTGLGLAICLRLVELMDGKISADSELGTGSTFSFSIPVRVVSSAPARQIEGTILVAEPSSRSSSALSSPLTLAGGSVQTVTTEAELIAAVRSESEAVALVFSSAMAGEGDVIATLQRIQRSGAQLPPTVLTVPAGVAPPSAERRRAAGVRSCLSQPASPGQIYSSLQRAIEDRTATAEIEQVKEDSERPTTVLRSNRSARTKVLVVEDNPVNQLVAQRMLEEMGCKVDLAANGREAVDLLQAVRYAVVFMDCQMPVMDGYTATREIRKLPAPYDRTPIVAMTANAMAGDREKCLHAGMDDYLPKPINADDLRDMLMKWKDRQAIGAETGDPTGRAGTADLDVVISAKTGHWKPAQMGGGEVTRNDDPIAKEVILNVKVVESIKALQPPGGPPILDQIFELYWESCNECVLACQEAVNENDADKLRRAAHKLKGSSGNIGAEAVQARAEQIEDVAKTGEIAGAGPLITKLEHSIERVREEFSRLALGSQA